MDGFSDVLNHIHHVHIFAADIEKSIGFYEENFGGKVVFDADVAGARNVFMKIGHGRLHFYDQAPKQKVRGNIHHFGIQTSNIEAVVERLKNNGVSFNKDISDLGFWKYIMVPAPDDILIELFEIDKNQIPAEYWGYFE
jgi:catechol 2,3-dioxygenase-like lactoylglutathione lyase family enzyme